MLKTIAIPREVVLTAVFTGAVIIAPLLHSQLITGTIVNAALFGAAILVGFRAAAVIAVIPSLIALAVGTLPMAMAPMLPFIMVSNIGLAGVFSLLKKRNYWIAAVVASVAKFGLLVLSTNLIIEVIAHGQISLALASMMGWPQLITAFLGAMVAYFVFERKSPVKM